MNDLSLQDIRAAYEGMEIVQEWERRYYPDRERRLLQRTIARLGRLRTALDVGGGIGLHASLLREYVALVYHLDFSWTMCSYAKRRFCLDSVQGNALQLPFKTETFDLTITYGVSTFVRSEAWRIQTVAEMVRVTKLGGFVIISTANGDGIWAVLKRNRDLHLIDSADERLIARMGLQRVRRLYGNLAPPIFYRISALAPVGRFIDLVAGQNRFFSRQKTVVFQKLYPADNLIAIDTKGIEEKGSLR